VKNKLFTSTNSKKGIFLEIDKNKLKVSIWKKETPIGVNLDSDAALEIASFIKEELDNPDTKKNDVYWKNYVHDFLEERVNKAPPDEEPRVFPEVELKEEPPPMDPRYNGKADAPERDTKTQETPDSP